MNNGLVEVVGEIKFDGVSISVYEDLNNPLFRIQDVAKLIGYRQDNAHRLLEYCEEDEQLTVRLLRFGQRRKAIMVTEMGLYNVLAQSRMIAARKWRRIIFEQLIELRKEAERNIAEQFVMWDSRLDDVWFDEETGKHMYAMNGPGGTVEIHEMPTF